MEIGIEYSLEKVALKLKGDDTRENLTHIQIKSEFARVTDGVIVAYAPVKMDTEDAEGLITVEAFTLARDHAKSVKEYSSHIALGEVCELENGITVPRPKPVTDYPNLDGIMMPALELCNEKAVAFNPKRLMALADALGATDGVILYFKEDGNKILVKPLHESNRAIGVLTPMRFKSENLELFP